MSGFCSKLTDKAECYSVWKFQTVYASRWRTTWYWQSCAARVLGELHCFSPLIWNLPSPVPPLCYFPGLWSKAAWPLWRTPCAAGKVTALLIFDAFWLWRCPRYKSRGSLRGWGWWVGFAGLLTQLGRCGWSVGDREQPGFTAPPPGMCPGRELALPPHGLKFKCDFLMYNWIFSIFSPLKIGGLEVNFE